MSRLLCSAACTAFAVVVAGYSAAATVTLLPADINQGNTSTTQFADGNLTLTPLIGATPATFNAGSGSLGIDDQGTNPDAFNDPDTDPNNGNEEKLQFQFSATAGLSQIGWYYARANSGVSISGFLADPMASFSGNSAGLTVQYNAGVVSFDLPFSPAFSGNPGYLNFANPAASAGATLMLSVTDPNEAGAQFPIVVIEYATGLAIPEPLSAVLLGIGAVVGCLCRGSRRMCRS